MKNTKKAISELSFVELDMVVGSGVCSLNPFFHNIYLGNYFYPGKVSSSVDVESVTKCCDHFYSILGVLSSNLVVMVMFNNKPYRCRNRLEEKQQEFQFPLSSVLPPSSFGCAN